MNIEVNDLITLNDGDKYIIIKTSIVNQRQYAYIVNINDKDDDGIVLIENNIVKLIDDPELIKKIIEVFKNVKA